MEADGVQRMFESGGCVVERVALSRSGNPKRFWVQTEGEDAHLQVVVGAEHQHVGLYVWPLLSQREQMVNLNVPASIRADYGRLAEAADGQVPTLHSLRQVLISDESRCGNRLFFGWLPSCARGDELVGRCGGWTPSGKGQQRLTPLLCQESTRRREQDIDRCGVGEALVLDVAEDDREVWSDTQGKVPAIGGQPRAALTGFFPERSTPESLVKMKSELDEGMARDDVVVFKEDLRLVSAHPEER